MIWSNFIIFLGLAAFGNAVEIEPEVVDALRAAGEYDALAEITGVDVKFLRPDPSGERSEGSMFNHVSHLGDIMLPEEQERAVIKFDKYPGSRWPNARMPYVISNSDFNDGEKRSIRDSISDFNRRSNVLKLVERNGEKDYVHVISGSGCWSYLGRTGDMQQLSLQKDGCLSRQTVQHEFMHAAGFHHEQNRLDRDNHVNILWDNIDKNWHSQYQQVSSNDYRDLGGYDHYSVMHYPIGSPGRWHLDAFAIPNGVDRNRLGQGENGGLARSDVDKLNQAYRR